MTPEAILKRAARELAAATDFQNALRRTLAACLPGLGDFGFFDAVAPAGGVVRVSAAYDDPRVEAILAPTTWARSERRDMNLCALSSGEAALHPDIDDAWYRAVAQGDGHLAVLRDLAFRSMVTVPLRHRDELIGALTLFMAGSGRRHGPADLELARDVAALASPMVANAALVEKHEATLAALRVSEERLRTSMQAARIGIWEWRLDDDSVYWSPEYRDIYGHGPDERPDFAAGIGRVVPEDVAEIEASWRAALATGVEFGTVHRIDHPARGRRYVQSAGRAVFDAAGKPVRLMGIVTDVTEAQRDRRELEQLREQLSEELHAIRRLHAVSSRPIRRDERIDDLMAEVLEAALDITGRERGVIRLVDATGDGLAMSASRGFSSTFFDRRERLTRDAPVPSAIAWRLQRRIVIEDLAAQPGEARGGGARLLLAEGVRAVQATPLVSRGGAVLGVLTTHANTPHAWTDRELRLLDILSREAADFIERAQAEAQLKEADRRKDEFLAILAHELRNPLAPIRYSVSIAREAGTTPQQRRRAEEVIERQVAHMGRLLDDLLDVSRIARGTVQLQRQSVTLDGIVAAATEAARPLVASRQHALEIRVPHGLVVDVDPVRLTQILTNLLNNAAKYTQPRGRITLVAEAEGGDLRLRVADNGMGLAEDVRPRLFTLFTQAPGALQRAEGGLGIGLALVKAFVELHGGTVTAHSAGIGLGSEFAIRLPSVVARRTMRQMDESMEPSTP